MNPSEIGARLKELRLRQGLTQKELAGEKITRNLLSLIESGNCSPSVSTLLYLAERLGVPAGYFFTDGDGEYMKFPVLGEAKEKMKAGEYRAVLDLCAALPEAALDDEISMIEARSAFRAAEEEARSYRLRDAGKLLDRAEAAASRSVYCTELFRRSAAYARELFESAATDAVSPVLCDFGAVGEFVPFPVAAYFSSLRSLKNGDAPFIPLPKGDYGERHISALVLLGGDRPREAAKKLRELSLDSSLPYYMQYKVLGDLESAANAVGDINLAYSSSRRRLELIDRIRF